MPFPSRARRTQAGGWAETGGCFDDNGKESPAGFDPVWHAKNPERGIAGAWGVRQDVRAC
ncbi:hypothetical protein [Streptomyces sp. WAC 06738]|uniref:hypothetical protein n=1 Tax=Streptomyces sp. WAC 06738 TaxID=2203210 RepID=UPI000F7B8501|nr:hypothetical protein [Streptomyces sp. WAC 06738]